MLTGGTVAPVVGFSISRALGWVVVENGDGGWIGVTERRFEFPCGGCCRYALLELPGFHDSSCSLTSCCSPISGHAEHSVKSTSQERQGNCR